MGRRASFDNVTGSTSDNVSASEKLLGTSYTDVKTVAEAIEFVKHVSGHLSSVYKVSLSITAIETVADNIDNLGGGGDGGGGPHTHLMADITDLSTALSGKASVSHSHSTTEITGLDTALTNLTNGLSLKATATDVTTALAGKANTSHNHATSEITGLDTALSGKSNTGHNHPTSEITGLDTALSGKSATSHTHSAATTSVDGFMAAADKTKLNGIATSANNYVHPTGDGNLHIPATSTTNNGRFLKAGATAGSVTWNAIAWADIGTPPTTLAGYGITDAYTKTATDTLLNGKQASLGFTPENVANKGIANGYAPLGPDQKVPSANLPADGSYKGTYNASNNTPAISNGSGSQGDFYIVSVSGTVAADSVGAVNAGDQLRRGPTAWQRIPSYNAVSSVANKTGAVTLDTTDITGLTTALSGKAAVSHTHATSEITGLDTALSGKAASTHSHATSEVTGLDTALSNKQPLDGTLTAFAGLGFGANQYVYSTAADTFVLGTITATGRSILDDDTPADMRTTLQLGTAATAATGDFAPSGHVGATGAAHGAATTSVNGFMASTDKTKLDGIAASANNYAHPTGDGNLHVPATSTTNNTKTLKAGATAGSLAWGFVDWSELASKPTTISGFGLSDAYTKTEINSFLGNKLNSSAVSAFGLTLIDDADQATARSTLGLGSAATFASTAFAAASHGHATSEVTGLVDALAGKAAVSHSHPSTEVTGLGALATLGSVGTGEITNSAVTNAKLANMLNKTFKGRNSAGEGPVEDLTAAQTKSLLNIQTADVTNLDTILASKTSAPTVTNSNPTVNDDSADGYVVGSRWINSNTLAEYVCVNTTVGAALWRATGNDVQTFTANGTWTKPIGVTAQSITRLYGIGPGGGGGSGRQHALSQVRSGGGGGASGLIAEQLFMTSDLGATEAVTMGNPGSGGNAQASASSNGNPGGTGGTCSFGNIFRVLGGNGGAGGNATNGIGGTAYSTNSIYSTAGANAGASGAAGVVGNTTQYGPGSGASGGGVTTAEAVSNGGVGGAGGQMRNTPLVGGTAGVAPGGAGGAGTDGLTSRYDAGGGGGGGASSVTGAGGAGGAGGKYGGGGGGGGASLNGAASGAGGAGGPGIIIAITTI